MRVKWEEPKCRPTVGTLWAHRGKTVGKWNEIDKQMQKHTHKVANIKANDYVSVGQHSTIPTKFDALKKGTKNSTKGM